MDAETNFVKGMATWEPLNFFNRGREGREGRKRPRRYFLREEVQKK
jgi:hypothetical protein